MTNERTHAIKETLLFILIAFGFSWFFWLFDVLDGMKVIALPFSYFVLYAIGAHGSLVAALVMTGRLEGWAGIKSLLKSGFKLRIPVKWWLIILILPALLSGLTLWVNVSLNNFQFDKSLITQPWTIPIAQWLDINLGIRLMTLPLVYLLSAKGMFIWLVIVLILSAIASLLPTHNATRLTIREVLAYE